MTSLDSEDFAHNQSVRHNGPRLGEDPAQGLAGYVHHPGRRFLIQPLIIHQADGLQPFYRKDNLFSAPRRHPVGNKSGDDRTPLHPP